MRFNRTAVAAFVLAGASAAGAVFTTYASPASRTPALSTTVPAPIVTDDLIRCEPGVGGRIFAGGGDVVVQVLAPNADLTSDIFLYRPGQAPRPIGSSRDVNKPAVLLGHFTAGSELVFGIVVRGSGNTFKTGAGSRNSDGRVHAEVYCFPNGRAEVRFEDIFGGGDNDFDDVRIHITNKGRRGITEAIQFPPCKENVPASSISPTWGHFNNGRPMPVLRSNAGEELRLICSPVNGINSYQLLYTRPGSVGETSRAVRIGLCPFRCGHNNASFMYTGDANGDDRPDRLILTYWKSRDYGANDNPNLFTGASEDTPVLDHAVHYYEMDTDIYTKSDDKYAYAVPPPAPDSCAAAVEGQFLGRQTVPRTAPERFIQWVAFHHPRSQGASLADEQDPFSLADLNRDGNLNDDDSHIFESTYAKCVGDVDFSIAADFDGDGCVTSVDREVWLDLFAGSAGNHAPRAIVKNIELSANESCTASVNVNDVNDGSFDPDGDDISLMLDNVGPFGVGDHIVTLTATDTHGASSSFSTIITVVPINISNLSVSKLELWPANHKMVDVTVNYDAVNNCSGAFVTCALTVSSSEPLNGTGDGDTAPDWQIIDAHRVRLRAERAGTGSGRLYTITITCTDSGGNISTKNVTVSVPKSKGKASA